MPSRAMHHINPRYGERRLKGWLPPVSPMASGDIGTSCTPGGAYVLTRSCFDQTIPPGLSETGKESVPYARCVWAGISFTLSVCASLPPLSPCEIELRP